MKTTFYLATAFVLLAPSAHAVQDNSAAVSGSNNDLNQITGNGNVLSTGSGAFGSSASTTVTNTANGGNSTANGGAGGSVIGSGNSNATGGSVRDSGNSSSVANGGQGGRGGDGGTGVGVGVGGDARSTQTANTGSQSIHVAAPKRNAPAILSAGLVAGSDTCLGSSSAGITTPFGGLSGGGTETDKDCVRIKMGRELTARGFDGAAVAMLCHNEEVRRAMATAGTPCANDAKVAVSAHEFGETVERSAYPSNGSRNR